jgi:hypothetical protein
MSSFELKENCVEQLRFWVMSFLVALGDAFGCFITFTGSPEKAMQIIPFHAV